MQSKLHFIRLLKNLKVRKLFLYTVEPRFTNLIRSWGPLVTRNVRKPKLLWSHGVLLNNILKKSQNTMKFKKRHGKFEQVCVPSESYTATDALPPILPACRQPLLLTCVFVTRNTVRHPRLFFRNICSWTDLFAMRDVREPRFCCIYDTVRKYFTIYRVYLFVTHYMTALSHRKFASPPYPVTITVIKTATNDTPCSRKNNS
jgi:hypothetical protein